jgi:hypothetical protein
MIDHPLGNCLSTWGADSEARSIKAGPLFDSLVEGLLDNA